MKDYKEEGKTIVLQTRALAITDEETYMIAESLGKAISEKIKEIKDYFKGPKADAKKAHQNWVEAERNSLEQPEKAKSILKANMLKYEAEIEAERKKKEDALKKELEAQKEDNPELELFVEDIVVQPTYTKQGQTRTTQELVVTDLKAFLVYLGQSNLMAEDFLNLNRTTCKTLAKTNVPGLKLEEKKIKVF